MAIPKDIATNIESRLGDCPEKRYFQYVLSGIEEFQGRALATIAASGDKSLVKTSGSIGKALAMVVSTAISAGITAGTGLPKDPGVGMTIGKVVEFGANAYERHQEHVKIQKIETFFEGLEIDEELEKNTTMLLETFSNIFLNYNIQFCHLLKEPKQSWTRAMKTLAKDSVHRIFDQLAKEEFDTLSQDLITDCFLKGNSKFMDWSTLGKSVIKGGLYRGETIETQQGKLTTADLFEKPKRSDVFNHQDTLGQKYRVYLINLRFNLLKTSVSLLTTLPPR